MLPQSDDNPITEVNKQFPIISLEYTTKGVLRKKLYDENSLSAQFVRISAITFPRLLEIYSEKQLPQKISKAIKKLRYNTSAMIDEEATYRSLRNKYLLHNQTTIDTKAIRDKFISFYLSQLIKNDVAIHIINLPEENMFLVIGVEYSSKVFIHPKSGVRSQIVNGLANQHYVLDQYPNLIGMESLAKINKDFQISFFRSTRQHPQMQKIDRTIIYNLIDRITKTSKLDSSVKYNYDIDGFSSSLIDDPLAASRHCFQLFLENKEEMNYIQMRGTSLVVLADHDKFQAWILKYSFYLEFIKSPRFKKVDTSILVVGGPKPLGYIEVDPADLRLDLLAIIKDNPVYVWMPVFRLIGVLYAYSARQNTAAEFHQFWSDIRQALGELMSQVDSFDKLLDKLLDSFENEINLTDDTVARSLLSIFNQIKLVSALDKGSETYSLPKRAYISSENYKRNDILLTLYTLSLRADLDGTPLHSLVINDSNLSGLMTMDKIRVVLDDKNTGFDDICKVYRTTKMRQSRFNTMPKIILSYNNEVRKYLTKTKFAKYEDGKKRIPLFEKSCLLLPDQPIKRIFVSKPNESLINSVLFYENHSSRISPETEIADQPNESSELEKVTQRDSDPVNAEVINEEITIVDDSVEEETQEHETPVDDTQINQDHIIEDGIDAEIDNLEADHTSGVVKEENTTELPLENQDEIPPIRAKKIQEIPLVNTHIGKKELKHEASLENSILSSENLEGSSTIQDQPSPAVHNIDEALRQYNEIFDIQKLYDQLLQNQPNLPQETMFTQIDTLVSNLTNLYQFYLTKNVHLSKVEVMDKGLHTLRDNELIAIHPTGDNFIIELTEKGNDDINQSLRLLNLLCSDIKHRGFDIQNIMINSSSIMEQFRQQGKIKYEVALLNWPKLLSLAYYDKFSKLAPIAYGIYVKITKLLDDGSWIANHEEFVKTFTKRYQNALYGIEQEILTYKDQVLEEADMKTLPKIKVIKPSDSTTEEGQKLEDSADSDTMQQIDTTLQEFDKFVDNEPVIENLTDKEIIQIQTFEKVSETKPVIKPKKTKAAIERAARILLKQQKEAYLQLINNNEYQGDFAELETNERNNIIQQRMEDRIKNINSDGASNLYFFQPSWNMSIDENKQKFELRELPISLFNLKPKTKKMLSGVLETASVQELMNTKIDWSNLPSIGKKTHKEIVDFQLLFENWNKLKGEEIFKLMSRDGLKHLFEQEIFFEPKKLPDNILLPLHENLKLRYERIIDTTIRNNIENIDGSEISRKIVSTICNDLCLALDIEVSEDHPEVLIHKINQFQHSNYKMSNAEKDPYFDLSWMLKFDNYNNVPEVSMSLEDFKTSFVEDLNHLMLSYQVQKDLLDLDMMTKKSISPNKERKEQLA